MEIKYSTNSCELEKQSLFWRLWNILLNYKELTSVPWELVDFVVNFCQRFYTHSNEKERALNDDL